MSAQLDSIDDAVSTAQQALIDAANMGPYSAALQAKLDAATALLQNIENSMVLATQKAILDALSNNNTQLKQLNTDIDAYATGIDQTAATIKKVSSVVGTVVGVIGDVISAGVI
jgi:hypothetical protein